MYQTLLYYKYVRIANAAELAAQHLVFCQQIGLFGRVLIADEGINGTVSGTVAQCETYMQTLRQDERFADIHYKIDEVSELSFVKMHVRYKPEIVHSELPLAVNPADNQIDNHLSPAEFLAIKDDENVLILDVRSNYEHQLGKFKNALTLDMENFRDLPQHLPELEKYKDKKILTYCTGGIKCEKASAYLREQGFNEVYQLQGGIINYGKMVGGQDFEGHCYVFDNRVQVAVNTVNPTVITRCKSCGTHSTRMVNCANPHCNEHFVQCENCGGALQGVCTTACGKSKFLRPYNPKGYYAKIFNG